MTLLNEQIRGMSAESFRIMEDAEFGFHFFLTAKNAKSAKVIGFLGELRVLCG